MYQNPYQSQSQVQASSDNYAGFWHKACASTIDTCILTTLGIAIELILKIDPKSDMSFVVFFSVNIVYFTGFLATFQTTPGGMLMGLRVCDKTGGKISFGQAFIRSFMGFVSLCILGIGYLISALSDTNQTLHDKVAKTYVKTEKENASFKYFFRAVLISFLGGLFITFIRIVSVVGIEFIEAYVKGSNYRPKIVSGQKELVKTKQATIKPKWISSPKRVKQKSFNNNQINKMLILKKLNKMPTRLAKMQALSTDSSFQRKDFKKAIPLKLKGVFAMYGGQSSLEIGTLNKLFYHILDYEVLDQKNNRLKESIRSVYSKVILTPYSLPKDKPSNDYKLRIGFPTQYTVVYFTAKDPIGSAYKLPKGTTIQLRKHFEFSINGDEFENLKFIPQNSSKKVIPIHYTSFSSNQNATVSFSSSKDPIAFVSMLYIKNKDYIEESFNIK